MEMKKRGEKLQKHYTQAFEYWLQLVPQRPRYVVLCNFDEFWIYDFDSQLNDPVDTVALAELPQRFTAFNFLFPTEKKPQFGNNRVDVTRAAAANVAGVFNSLVARNVDREQAQRFTLQCVVAMFSEDAALLPRGRFTELLDDCRRGASTYDRIGGLFRQMNSASPAPDGDYLGVPYFNGGLFQTVHPVALNAEEIGLMLKAAEEDWSKVQPPIFGTLFQSSMGKERRHAFGAHFTSEADIQKVVLPTIVRPWRERIESTKTFKDLRTLLGELRSFRVLDPACGSGNFLYVAFRELKRLELSLMAKIHAEFGRRAQQAVGTRSLVSIKQFFGIDKEEFAVELAKVTLMIAKELAIDESQAWLDSEQPDLPIEFDAALPLDNLDENIKAEDALFSKWPRADAIVGNPPFQSKNKMQQEYGPDYLNRLRDAYPEVPGRADYCVYWFRKSHDALPMGGRAGLVGTNTIRQNYSRQGGLDYIVGHGGTITEAVSTQVWSGDAVVHVSIANWIKGEKTGKKKLFTQVGDQRDSPWQVAEVDEIGPALSGSFNVTQALRLRANMDSEACYQGQTHGHDGFLLDPNAAATLLNDPESRPVVHPYITGDELLSLGRPGRFIIDLSDCVDVISALSHGKASQHVRSLVMPAMMKAAEQERKAIGRETGPRQSHFLRWWRLWRARPEMLKRLGMIPRYIACARVTKRPIFEFIDAAVHPSDVVQVFTLPDDYSFGVLQSGLHWAWFVARCSTLKGDFRYTSDTVFDTFPWSQNPTLPQVKKVAEAAVALRALRRKVMAENNWSLRELYRTLDTPGKNPLRDAQDALDAAVRAAYGMKAREDPLAFLLALNGELADREATMRPIVGPGLPPVVRNPEAFITSDCIGVPACPT